MSDTTLTFSALSGQTPVKLINDPSKPGWEDLLASDSEDEDEDEGKEKELPQT